MYYLFKIEFHFICAIWAYDFQNQANLNQINII